MSAKPTPGPYKICYVVDDKGLTVGCSVITDDDRRTVVALFWRHDSLRTAMANARAWVDGMAAMEGIRRLRNARENYGRSGVPTDAEHRELVEAMDALLEAKP